MSSKVLKRILTGYLEKFAEPKIKELTGEDISLSLWGVKKFVPESGKEGIIFIDTEPIVRSSPNQRGKRERFIEKIIEHYVSTALRFVGEDINVYKIMLDKRSLEPMDENVLPFNETIVNEKRIRVFKEDVDSGELQWHRDREDRLVKIIKCDGWKLQFDNQTPVLMEAGQTYEIPKGVYHRVIKGKDDLKIEVTFL